MDAAGPGLLENLGLKVDCLASTMERPQSADGSAMRVRGSLAIKFSLGNRNVQTTVYIIENLQAVLLGNYAKASTDTTEFSSSDKACGSPNRSCHRHFATWKREGENNPGEFNGRIPRSV